MRAGVLLLLPILACGRGPGDATIVCAAASLREVAAEVGDAWAAASGATVEYRFDSSDALARQIREGARCDVFLSADPKWAAELNAIESFPWIGSRLVGVRLRGATVDGLAKARSLALGSGGTPVGRYAAAAMRAMGVAPPERTILGSSVRDVLSKVAEGAAELGIVYATDVAVDPRVEIAFEIPGPSVVYPVLLMTERGRALYGAFRAPAALEAARRRGFLEAR